MSKELLTNSLTELAQKISKKEISSKEVTQAYLNQIDHCNQSVNAFVHINQNAIAEAEAADAKVQKGEDLGPLAGVPIGIKDMLCVKDMSTTAASKLLDGFIPPYSATVVERLKKSGAVILGKTNQDEFAMGSSNEISHYGKCTNPWSEAHVPGGSSGGSAAAVAAGMAPMAIGTDTGGSIRQPASFCGVVGSKTTYGRVSRYGIVAFASSLDQAGPLSRTVEDAALVSEIISGHCPNDATSLKQEVPSWSKQLDTNIKGMKVGLPKEYFSNALSEDTNKVVQNVIQLVKDAGAEIVEVSLPRTHVAIPIYYIIATCEASSNLARYDGVRYGRRADFKAKAAENLEEFYSRSRGEGFGPEVKRRIMLGTYALSSGYYDAYYKKACQVRRLLKEDFENAFESCDLLLSPVTTTPAFKIGERVDDPVEMYMNDIYTTSANLAGIPGISVPAGFSKEALPIGVQLTAPAFQEQSMFNMGAYIEKALQLKEVPSVLR